MVSHPHIYLERLKKVLHLVHHYLRLEAPPGLLCLLAEVFSSRCLKPQLFQGRTRHLPQFPSPSITHSILSKLQCKQ